jgi:putative pyruvate formate lyase activating enzyme
MSLFEPAYLHLSSDELDRRAASALEHMHVCDLCAWNCGVDRASGKKGFCRTALQARVSSSFPHHGEENPLRGVHGSGTIFFSFCNLRCQFCQNYEISQHGKGHDVTAGQIAAMMLQLQAAGCHNINLVSPSHVVAQVIEAIAIAARQGLRLPIVYNTGGYDSLPALELLDGIVDIYMPDMKYSDALVAARNSKVKEYPRRNRAAVSEMHRQVGDLTIDERGIAQRGLLVRHLVLPEGLAGTAEVVRFLADEVSRETYVNLMSQYRPEYLARKQDLGPLSRPVTGQEMAEAYALAERAGLHRFDTPDSSIFLS